MRTIDADALMERLRAWDTADIVDKALYNFALNRVLEQPTIEPEQRWIPVSERPPDKEGNYLITAQPTYNHAKDIRIAHWSGRWVGYVKSEILAWMPLPEPYRPKEET